MTFCGEKQKKYVFLFTKRYLVWTEKVFFQPCKKAANCGLENWPPIVVKNKGKVLKAIIRNNKNNNIDIKNIHIYKRENEYHLCFQPYFT